MESFITFLFQLRFFPWESQGRLQGRIRVAGVAELEGVAEETPSPGGLPWPRASALLPVCTVSPRVYSRNGQARGAPVGRPVANYVRAGRTRT